MLGRTRLCLRQRARAKLTFTHESVPSAALKGLEAWQVHVSNDSYPSIAMQRHFHSCAPRNNSLILGGLALAGSAVAIRAFGAILGKSQDTSTAEETNKTTETKEASVDIDSDSADKKADESTFASNTAQQSKTHTQSAASDTSKQTQSQPFWASWFEKKFYEGGFEDKMTRREATLILGVRNSATVERINERYRKVLVLNHPDRGGSAYIAAKINEAKVMLLKGK